MKLYDAIREGCKVTEKTNGHLFEDDNDSEIEFTQKTRPHIKYTCALGAAAIISLDSMDVSGDLYDVFPVFNKQVPRELWPPLEEHVVSETFSVYTIVWRCNDGVYFKEHSREGIAEYLEWLEKEHGYNMSMAINDDEVEEDSVEENEEVLVYGS